MPGAEDVVADKAGRLYVSSADRHRVFHPAEGEPPTVVGGLYRVTLGAAGPPERLGDTGENFYPHGIDLLPGDGRRPDRLFVINHPLRRGGDGIRWDRCQPESWIERYDVAGSVLRPTQPWRLAFTGDPRTNYNDVAAAGPDTFYVTGDSAAPSCGGRLAEFVLGWSTGRVLAYHAGAWATVADGIPFANGIALDHKRRRLYVAAMQEGALRVYHWTPEAPLAPLALDTVVRLGTGLDNITMPDEDTLLVAAHPSLLNFARTWFDSSWRPPAQVLRLHLPREPSNGGWVFDPLPEPPTEVVRDEGGRLSAASVALVPPGAPGTLAVGTVFGPSLALLEVNPKTSPIAAGLGVTCSGP